MLFFTYKKLILQWEGIQLVTTNPLFELKSLQLQIDIQPIEPDDLYHIDIGLV